MVAAARFVGDMLSKRHTMDLWPRHIQNFSEAQTLEPHWGYDDRALPCTKDAGACKYLDAVYHGHDVGMLYIGIIWATLFAILIWWNIARKITRSSSQPTILGPAAAYTPELQALKSAPRKDAEKSTSAFTAQRNELSRKTSKTLSAIGSACRRRLLPDFMPAIFGHTTRLQFLVLALLVGYLTIFSFAGLIYGKWISPVAGGKHSTRSTLGPWADRIGVLAYGLTPLSVLLSSRESILSLVTGLPYTKFNFLHRWLGYVIVVQSVLHTISWTVIEARLYQPQPTTGKEWITQLYMRWGLVAICVLMLLFVFSLPCVIRRTGYEFFRKTHYVLAMVYIGACWGHWSKLKVFLLPSLLIWFVDRGLRLVRSFLLHYNYISPASSGVAFRPAQANMHVFTDTTHGDVVRLDFSHEQQPWHVGQHFYLCYSELSIWQSHPFTPASYPMLDVQGRVRHTYIFRARGGETKKVAELAVTRAKDADTLPSTSVILAGPYGEAAAESLETDASMNVVCIAGGTGITYVLPIIKHALLLRQGIPVSDAARIELVWIVKRASDVAWVAEEVRELQSSGLVTLRVITTREEEEKTAVLPSTGEGCATTDGCCCGPARDSESTHEAKDSIEPEKQGAAKLQTRCGAQTGEGRPSLAALVSNALQETTVGATTVYASGPSSMLSDLRSIVASCNDGMATWKGIGRSDVRLVCDDRMEWF